LKYIYIVFCRHPDTPGPFRYGKPYDLFRIIFFRRENMKTNQLIVSGLHITEDEYSYKGQFILNGKGKSRPVDMDDLENSSFISELRDFFDLEEPVGNIRDILMDMIVEKAHISSKIVEGENYDESSKQKKVERSARSLDMS
jgi:hypothetical protein